MAGLVAQWSTLRTSLEGKTLILGTEPHLALEAQLHPHLPIA